MLKNIILLSLIILSISINFILFYYDEEINFNEEVKIEYSDIESIRGDLDEISSSITGITGADLVGINIFHKNEDLEWSEYKFEKNPEYFSSIYYWTKPGINNPLEFHLSRDLSKATKGEELLAGNCVGWLNRFIYETQPDLGEVLVLQCPLVNKKNQVYGSLSVSYTNYDVNNLENDIHKFLPKVLIYTSFVQNLLNKEI